MIAVLNSSKVVPCAGPRSTGAGYRDRTDLEELDQVKPIAVSDLETQMIITNDHK